MATKSQSSSYPLPGVTLPNVDYGSYARPAPRKAEVTPAGAMLGVLQQGDKLRQLRESERKREEELKKKETQAIIERMQTIQTNADLWNLQQMSDLNTIPQTTAIQDQLQATLQKRLDIATQAQVYLKTQYGDKKHRASAQKAVSDYYDLLALTKTTVTNFTALGSYWKEKAPTIGSAITIIGNDENEIANNQYFVNALGGIYDDADFEMVYDEENNDIMIKVSGYEHELDTNGNMSQGPHREKIMSARAFNARTAESKDFGFVSDVPQVVNETIKKLAPKASTPEGDGLGILNTKNVIAENYWIDDEVVVENLNDGYIRTSMRKKLNINGVKKDMQGLLKQKIGGLVSTGPQQLANFWNIDLRKLNEGFENSYHKLLPDNIEMENALFDAVIDSLTNYDGITKDDQGNIYMQPEGSISKPKVTTEEGPVKYRKDDIEAAVLAVGGGTEELIEVMNKFYPNKRYMTLPQMREKLLLNPHPDWKKEGYNFEQVFKNRHKNDGKNWREEYNKWFDKHYNKEGIYMIGAGGSPSYAGNYDFTKHVDKLDFLLNQLSSAERKKMDKTSIRKSAFKMDWMKDNPKGPNESDIEYAARVAKALKNK